MSKKIVWLIPMMLLVALFSIGKLVSAEVVSSLPTAQKGNATTVKTPSLGVASSTDFIWPTSVGHVVRGVESGHTGLDITGSARSLTFGQPVFAAKAGIVTFAGWNTEGSGNLIIIDNGDGYKTFYGHLSKIFIVKGDKVNQGQKIGAIGSTGRSTGPHLHFGMTYNKNILNPLDYVKQPTTVK